MKWTTEKRKLKDLIIYDKNPRILTSTQRGEIEKSLKKFDLVEIPAINKDNTIIAGHQRISVLKELKGDDYEIEVRVPETILNERDFKEYLLRNQFAPTVNSVASLALLVGSNNLNESLSKVN